MTVLLALMLASMVGTALNALFLLGILIFGMAGAPHYSRAFYELVVEPPMWRWFLVVGFACAATFAGLVFA